MRHLLYILFLVAATFATVPALGQDGGLSPARERRQARLFDEHTVRMGETAYSIARGYAISPATLAEDNPDVELTKLRVGQVLLIRKRERGQTPPREVAREWEQITDSEAEQNGNGQVVSEADPWNNPRSHIDSLREIYAPRTEGGIPEIALILPLECVGVANADFVDFYRGALLALEGQKAMGRSMNVTLYNSARSPEKVMQIVTSSEFSDTDLIIGPVYETEMGPAVEFGELFGIPVVSPLAQIENIESDALYTMAPDPKTKYDKLREMLSSGANIILVSSASGNDAEFEREITGILSPGSFGRFTLTGDGTGTKSATNAGDIASLIDWERENIFIVLAATEALADRALASISSAYTNASARRSLTTGITVLGSSKWAGYNRTIDKNLFFKLNVRFVTSYYINHSGSRTALFEKHFLSSYGNLPSRSAFRGYDAVTLFAGAIFEDGFTFPDRLAGMDSAPLGTQYNFMQKDGGQRFGDGFMSQSQTGGTHTNDQWTMVEFTDDYNVIIH